MFDQLSDRLQETLSDVRNRGKLTEADVDKAMREIRLALLEADVNFKVVKQFTAQVKERCLGAGVLDALNPGQQVVKIVNEELAALMGGASRDLAFASSGHDGDPDGRPAGLGQDDRLREARQAARRRRQEGRPRRLRHAAPGRGRAAGDDGQALRARPSTSRAPSAARSRSPSGRSARRASDGPRRADRRHRRAACTSTRS